MSKEKLYAVKNDEGKYWEFNDYGFWRLEISDFVTTPSRKQVEIVADEQGGHIVTFVEEPKKVVLTKEQAEIVKDARDGYHPASVLRFAGKDDEELLMNAYVNGYTVAKETKYYVKVPHTKNVWYYNDGQEYFDGQEYLQTICPANKKLRGKFTETEIEHYGLQDCEKVEVNDDEQ